MKYTMKPSIKVKPTHLWKENHSTLRASSQLLLASRAVAAALIQASSKGKLPDKWGCNGLATMETQLSQVLLNLFAFLKTVVFYSHQPRKFLLELLCKWNSRCTTESKSSWGPTSQQHRAAQKEPAPALGAAAQGAWRLSNSSSYLPLHLRKARSWDSSSHVLTLRSNTAQASTSLQLPHHNKKIPQSPERLRPFHRANLH